MAQSVAIIGYNTEGQASYEYFVAQGADITICDQNANLEVPEGVKSQLGENYLDNLTQFDLLIRTAGMPPHLILERYPDIESKISTNVNEFMKACPTRNIIGVTGTKGKGTTTSLIAELLTACGREVYVGGNIGVPPTTFLKRLTEDAWVVLELSSFQLMDLQHSPHIGVCLMVVPEHLNWHENMDEYTGAKAKLFAHQSAEDIAIYYSQSSLSRQIASTGDGQKVPFYESPGAYILDGNIVIEGQVVCATDDLGLLGEHNWQNACAAVTAAWYAGERDLAHIADVLRGFHGLEHRLEFVSTVNDVQYYNDSFGTTPETAIVALQAFTQQKVIILGGSDKGADYSELARTIANDSTRLVILIGEQGQRIRDALEAVDFHNYTYGGATMTEIVTRAREAAQPGDVVLLSPACASFDMFRDYKDRGDQFRLAVQALD